MMRPDTNDSNTGGLEEEAGEEENGEEEEEEIDLACDEKISPDSSKDGDSIAAADKVRKC